jgi:hypothetical protein
MGTLHELKSIFWKLTPFSQKSLSTFRRRIISQGPSTRCHIVEDVRSHQSENQHCMNRLLYSFIFISFYWRNKFFVCEIAEKCWHSVDYTATTTTTSVYVHVTYFRIIMESSLCIWAVSSPAISRVNVELLYSVSVFITVHVLHRMSDEASYVHINS